jgi:hypothetical protein
VSLDFRLEIIEINLSLKDVDGDNFQSNQNSACWIGSVSCCWNQTNVSVALTNAFQISLDCFQPSILASGAAVRLERYIIKFGDLLEPIFQFFNHCSITFGLIFWNKWMDV